MHGAKPLLAGTSRVSSIIGILYAEDFDEIPPEPQATEPEPEPVEPPLTQLDVDRACDAAVAAASLEWQLDAEQRRTETLAAIAAATADARNSAEQIAAAAAEGLAKTMLAMLSAALPDLCNQHGAAEVRAIVDRLLPMLRTDPRIIVRVHPDMASELQADFAARLVEFDGTLTVLPTALEPGDVTIEWQNGALCRDTRQILQAMHDTLGQLGLHPTLDTSPQRTPADAK